MLPWCSSLTRCHQLYQKDQWKGIQTNISFMEQKGGGQCLEYKIIPCSFDSAKFLPNLSLIPFMGPGSLSNCSWLHSLFVMSCFMRMLFVFALATIGNPRVNFQPTIFQGSLADPNETVFLGDALLALTEHKQRCSWSFSALCYCHGAAL